MADIITMNVLVTFGAGFQLVSPGWLATMLTEPAPVKVRFVPPVIMPGPLPTAKLTGRPLDAVAANCTRLLVN